MIRNILQATWKLWIQLWNLSSILLVKLFCWDAWYCIQLAPTEGDFSCIYTGGKGHFKEMLSILLFSPSLTGVGLYHDSTRSGLLGPLNQFPVFTGNHLLKDSWKSSTLVPYTLQIKAQNQKYQEYLWKNRGYSPDASSWLWAWGLHE